MNILQAIGRFLYAIRWLIVGVLALGIPLYLYLISAKEPVFSVEQDVELGKMSADELCRLVDQVDLCALTGFASPGLATLMGFVPQGAEAAGQTPRRKMARLLSRDSYLSTDDAFETGPELDGLGEDGLEDAASGNTVCFAAARAKKETGVISEERETAMEHAEDKTLSTPDRSAWKGAGNCGSTQPVGPSALWDETGTTL